MRNRPVAILWIGALALCGVAALCGAAAVLAADAKIEIFRPVTPEEAEITLLPSGIPSAASGLDRAASCSETVRRSAVVELRWKPGSLTAGAQRVDISKFRDGFELGRYEVSPELTTGRASVGIAGPEPGINYYWRVLTQTPQGWAPSRVERFEVPVCPWDPPRLDGLEGATLPSAAPLGGAVSPEGGAA